MHVLVSMRFMMLCFSFVQEIAKLGCSDRIPNDELLCRGS